MAGFTLFAFTVLVIVAPASGASHWTLWDSDIEAMLKAATAALALLLAVLLFHRSRLTGDAPAVWLAAGLMVLSVLTLGGAELVPLLSPTPETIETLRWLRLASIIAVFVLLSLAVATAEIDSRLRLSTVVAVTIAAIALSAMSLPIVAGIAALLPIVAVTSDAGTALSTVLVGVGWAALATAYLVRGVHERRHLFAWFGLMLAAMTFGEFAMTFISESSDGAAIGAALLHAAAVLFGIVGALRELHLAFAAQSSRLLHSHIEALTREARLAAERAERAERAHEARNALTAIEGATQTLERFRERLDAEDRERLAAAVTTEIARLQQLVSSERASEAPQAFDLGELADQQAALARAGGTATVVEIAPGTRAFGRRADTGQALRNLLVNAARHAPGSPVIVRARVEGEGALVSVEDRGPGVPVEQREQIFVRGHRGSQATPGDGLGLYVARQLLREQDGDVWVEAGAGGGARFVLALPAASAAAGTSQADDEVGDGVDVAKIYALRPAAADDRATAAVSGSGGQDDHHVGLEAVGERRGGQRDVEGLA